jgi:UDP-N-acetylglucosamine--N-acetylmuramyl-(pentapeptide) pyrophosphoryl-undecaprenol N-acetylglucosamine transferase
MTTVLLAGGGTGGHLMPALAVAEATRLLHPDWRFVFAGAERGIEATVLAERGLPYQLLPLQPLYRRQWWKNLQWPLLLPSLVRRIDALLQQERPDAVIGTGGYVSGPVLWRAARQGIPTGILELDVRPGVATRLLVGRVRELWLAAPEAAARLPAVGRVTVTGAPISPPDPAHRAAAVLRFGISGDRPVVVVTGGSQGSLAINRVVAAWLGDGGGAGAQVIWATGRATYAEFASLHNPPEVHVIPFIDPMAHAWSVADLCVARAGMMTLAELCAWGIPSVLIPLPSSAADHQTYNARAMESASAAVMLPQGGRVSRRRAAKECHGRGGSGARQTGRRGDDRRAGE